MQLAIVHFHLNRGGVTQVILNHLQALAATLGDPDPLRVVVFYGGRCEAWREDVATSLSGVEVTLKAIPELEYDTRCEAFPEVLADRLLAALRGTQLRPDDTVIHIHNHALGKNFSLPAAITQLAAAGYGLVLQIHDFAEDFRPDNYRDLVQAMAANDPLRLADRLYPQGSAIHYAVLNGRDRKILADAGVDPTRLHARPNPVGEFGTMPERAAARAKLAKFAGVDASVPYVVYPVRGIRRKNLGELLLWAAACGREAEFAQTLPPLNPLEQPRYNSWKQLAQDVELPIRFEVGVIEGLSFAENLAAADQVLTTSVAEGFGMVFLESWLAGRSLIGRDLPEITTDFVSSGLAFPHLQDQVQIPIDWIEPELFVDETRSAYATVLQAYGRRLPDRERLDQQVSALFADGLLDFARCSARLQAAIVARVAHDRGLQEELRQRNPGFGFAGLRRGESCNQLVAANARAVRNDYSLESSGIRLRNLYQIVLESPRGEQLDFARGESVLDAFLSLPRFNPIRID